MITTQCAAVAPVSALRYLDLEMHGRTLIIQYMSVICHDQIICVYNTYTHTYTHKHSYVLLSSLTINT